MSEPSTRSALLADRHHGFAEGLRGLLETAFESVFIVGDRQSLLEGVERLRPAVTIVDLSLVGNRWLELIREIVHRAPEEKLIVMSFYDEESVARAAIGAGAQGFVLKRAAATDLLDAAAAVERGETYLSPGVRHAAAATAPRHGDEG